MEPPEPISPDPGHGAPSDDWASAPPQGQPRVDLPPPVPSPPATRLVGELPDEDHVPFDMDFIARALAAVIGEDPFPRQPPAPQPAEELLADVLAAIPPPSPPAPAPPSAYSQPAAAAAAEPPPLPPPLPMAPTAPTAPTRPPTFSELKAPPRPAAPVLPPSDPAAEIQTVTARPRFSDLRRVAPASPPVPQPQPQPSAAPPPTPPPAPAPTPAVAPAPNRPPTFGELKPRVVADDVPSPEPSPAGAEAEAEAEFSWTDDPPTPLMPPAPGGPPIFGNAATKAPAPAPPPAPVPPTRSAADRARDEQAEAAIAAASVLRADGRLFRAAPPRQSGVQPNRLGGIRVALRTLLRQRRRMLLSIIAVSLGVGYLAGSLSLLQRVGAGLAAQAGADSERADLVVEGTIADDGPLQQVRKLVPDSIGATLRSIEGIAAVEPRLESNSTLIIGSNGAPVVKLGLTERPLGANFPVDDGLNPYRFIGTGRAPTTESEVVIDRNSARVAKVGVGDRVRIAGKTNLNWYTVTGIVEMTDGDLPAGSSLALFETEAARPLFELGTDDNAIAIRLDKSADIDAVRAEIERVLYSGAEVSTGAEYAEHRQASLEKSFTMIRALLVGFAGLALVVGAFTVANSMALLFDHRRRGFAMLRLMGASPSQLVGAAGAESLLGGVLAGIVGLALGLGVGAAIERLIQSMGTPLPVAGSALTWWIPVVAIVVGATVTVATALSPARHASRTPPVHAVTGADDRPTNLAPLALAARWIAALVLVGGGAAVAGGILGGTSIAMIAGGAGVVVALVLIVLPRLLSGIVGATTALLLGSSVALRRMSTLRSRQARTRAASTTAALLLAAAVVSGLTVLSSSFLESIEGQITTSIRSDLVVDSATFTKGGLSADLIPELRKQPGVAAVSGWRPGAAFVGSSLWRAGGVDGASMFRLLNLDVIGRAPSSFGVEDVVVSETLAADQTLEVGQDVPVTFQNGVVVQMKVRAIFRSDLNVLLGDVLVDTTVLATNLPQSTDVLAFVKLTKNAPASTKADITTLSKRYGAANVLKPSELVSTRAELLRGFSRVIQWMLAFSVILALIGVANTLQLGVNERRRELGLIRAVGATRAQVLRLVMAEATALSLVGTLCGLAVGVGGAYATVSALSRFGLNQFVAPAGTLIGIFVIAIGLGLVGAIVPAMRAADIPLLEAIAEGGDEHRTRRSRRAARPAPAPAPSPASDGGPRRAPGNVDPSGNAARTGPATTPTPEVKMALRCYNCGHEPGDGEACSVCGAPQTATPVGMFTERQEVDAPGQPPLYDGADETSPISVTYGADIVDAAVVEDGHVVSGDIASDAAPTASADQPMWTSSGDDSATPPPYVATESSAPAAPEAPAPTYGVTAQPEAAGQQVGSIFESRPTPSEAHDPMRSPFGQHATVAEEPRAAEPLPAQRHGIFTAGAADAPTTPAESTAPTSSPTPGATSTPPAFATTANGAAGANGTVTSEARIPAAPTSAYDANGGDIHGFAASVSRLSGEAQENGRVPFSIAGALLHPQEHVLATVAGSSLGMPTVVVVTEIRALIVSDRRYVPDVEIFDLGPTLTVHGRHANGQASLTFGDHDRLVTVDQITDVGLAVELATVARNPSAVAEF